MNNDLISRSALIQHAYSAVVDGVEKDIIDLSDVDNAPTVELDEGVIQEVLKKRGMTVITNEYLITLITSNGKRPQGEWIDHSENEGYVECPICGHLTNCEGNIDELHYCWNCGAKLQKGGAE